MDILLEKEFLDVLVEDLGGIPRPIAPGILEDLFIRFSGLILYTDMEDAVLLSHPLLKSIGSINKSKYSKSDFVLKSKRNEFEFLSIAFCGCEKQEWIKEFKKNGGLYFNTLNYRQKILEISNKHDTIYFNERKEFNWSEVLHFNELPFKGALIADNYILSDKLKMDKNAFPIINEICTNNRHLTILTTTRSSDSTIPRLSFKQYKLEMKKLLEKAKDEVSQKQKQIKRKLNTPEIHVQVVPFFKRSLKSIHNFDLHDRRLMTKYSVISVGKGFDLLPLKPNTKNDYELTISTFLDKKTYDDIRVFMPLYNQYVKWYMENHNPETFLPFE